MTKNKLILLLLFFGAAHYNYAQQNSINSANAQHSSESAVDVEHINLDIQIDPIKKSLKGIATIQCSLLRQSSSIHLDAVDLDVLTIRLQHSKNLNFSYDTSKVDKALEITLDKAYKPNEKLIFEITYQMSHINETDPFAIGGSNGAGVRFLAPSSFEKSRQAQVWSMGEPTGNRYWFPGNDDPNDLRTTTLLLTMDTPFVCISNGNCTQITMNDNGTKTYKWEMKTPYPNHKTAFVIGKFVNHQQQYGQVSINNYCYPAEKNAVMATTERLPDMMHFFSQLTQKEYPYSSYTQAFVQEIPWGIANTTLATQTENMIDDYPTHKDYLYLWDAFEGESLAAQWFGNYVGISSWDDVWLEKGLSRYVSWMYCEYKNGHDEFLLYQYVTDFFSYKGTWDAGVKIPIVRSNYDLKAELTDPKYLESNYPYFKADLVWHMLRKELGDEKFKLVLQKYIKTFGGKTASTKDIIHIVDAVNGKPMQWFFDQWVYHTGHPIFEVAKNYNLAQHQLNISIKQLQQPDTAINAPQVQFFQGKMDIEIDDSVYTIFLQPKSENEFSFDLRKEPMFVNIDYENTWIKELNIKKPTSEWLYQLSHDKDIMGRYFALLALSAEVGDSTTSSTDRNAIWNGIKELLQSNVYWRLKYAALLQVQSLFNAGMNGQSGFTFTPIIVNELKEVVQNNTAWVRATAIAVLGMSKDSTLSPFYLLHLNDSSERVVNSAAIALGKSKSSSAYDNLIKLIEKPSWKNQSLISALYALTQLKDERAQAIALAAATNSVAPHWTLATPVWDHRLAAINTLVAIGKDDSVYPFLKSLFLQAIQEDNMNDIFYVAQQISMLSVAEAQEIFETLKNKYNNNADALSAAQSLELQFQNNIKK